MKITDETIKQFVIGSDDDSLTLEAINDLPTIPFIENQITSVNNYEEENNQPLTDEFREFIDNDYWAIAYEQGYKTYHSYTKAEYNEIVYLIKE